MSSAYLDFHNPALRFLYAAVLILAVAGLIFALLSFLRFSALQQELKAVKKSIPKKMLADPKVAWDDCAQRISQLAVELGELRRRVDTQEQTAPSAVPVWPVETASIQLNRRGQILRLAGKGKSVAEIAQDLGVPRGEVELLLKVQDLGQTFSDREDSVTAL